MHGRDVKANLGLSVRPNNCSDIIVERIGAEIASEIAGETVRKIASGIEGGIVCAIAHDTLEQARKEIARGLSTGRKAEVVKKETMIS